ncbi:MAG: thioredoxin-like domain-containing protein [Acidobacteriota bacterium]
MISTNFYVTLLSALVLLAASACQAGRGTVSKDETLEGYVNAPDFPPHLEWLNSGKRLSLRELRGKLVLLDFWTYCCINCMHIIPELKKLEEKYPQELVVIGVHSAKFTNEKEARQIRQAILRYEIRHPVLNDNNYEVWHSYGVSAWPTLVLISPNGRIIGQHSGEGVFEPFDAVISRAIPYFEKKGELKRSTLKLALEETERGLLHFPGKISADPARKRLFISDSNHNRIVVAGADGAIQEVIGGGQAGLRDGAFEQAAFDHPQGTAIAGEILYIADTENHVIRAADLAARTVTTILGSGQQARRFNVSGAGRGVDLSSPWDVVVHNGRLYIAMAGTHQLWVADLRTLRAEPYAGSAREARIDGELRGAALAQPSGLATDGQRLYFADSETSSIRAADLGAGGSVRTIVGEDLFVFGDVDGPRNRARLQHPLGVAFNDGLIYVADTYNSKIKVVDPARGMSVTYAGKGKPGFADGKLAAAMFNEPGGLAFLDGKLYVADTNNHRVRVVDPAGGEVRTLPLKNRGQTEPSPISPVR